MTTPTEGPLTTGSPKPHSERMTVTVKEAANLLGVSRSLAYELVAAGTLPSLRLGRRIVVPRAVLLRMLDSERSGETTAAPTPRPDEATAGPPASSPQNGRRASGSSRCWISAE